MHKKKETLGQFNTTNSIWLKEHVKQFILDSKCDIAYDPFAGKGDLLNASIDFGFDRVYGFDIDESLSWGINDSLVNIPSFEKAIIITNPPYLTKYSAKRKGIQNEVKKYFDNSNYIDLYLIAIEKMLEAQNYVVAIIPETFINSKFPKERLESITILEENPFDDTETPVCVVCFDGDVKEYKDIKVYRNDKFIGFLNSFDSYRMKPNKKININFNCLEGKLALRAVDSTNPNMMISFMKPEELNYDLKGIKISSRLITIIDIKEDISSLERYIILCNKVLNEYRENTLDITLSPFKGNMKNGKRRRRLDYKTARAIMELAYEMLKGENHD